MTAVVIPEHIPAPLRWLGARWKDGRRSYRMRWGELSFFVRGFGVDLCLFEEHYSLHVHALWVNAYITLPFLQRWHYDPFEMMESWGFHWTPDMGIHAHWGRRTKIITMPWRDWVQTEHAVRRPDGTWAPFVGSWEIGDRRLFPGKSAKEPDGREEMAYPYRYVLRSGELQERTATIHVERRIRKLKWLRWMPLGRTVHAISVEFSDEVGERTGSWKGGTIGCGYELRENETPLECLRRMETERKF
jgi:hypothetical protein